MAGGAVTHTCRHPNPILISGIPADSTAVCVDTLSRSLRATPGEVEANSEHAEADRF